MRMGGRRCVDAPPPRATANVDFELHRSPSSPSLARSSSAPTLNDGQVAQAGVSSERQNTPKQVRRGNVPVGLQAQRPEHFEKRGKVSSPAANTPAGVEKYSIYTPRTDKHTGHGVELRGRCKPSAGGKQEALAAYEAHGIHPGIELCPRRNPGACSPRSSSQQPASSASQARSASQKGIAARSYTRLGHNVDINVACTKGQGSCSPRNESHAKYAAWRDRSFERRQEGARLGSSDIDAVPRSRPGTCSPRQVRRGSDSATNLVSAEARAASRSTKNLHRSITPRRSSWPEPQEYLEMIGAERAQGRTPGAPRLAGTVLAEIRASVPRPPSREREPALHTLLRQERLRSGPPPRCLSSQHAAREQHVELDMHKLWYARLDWMMERQASTGSSASCDSADDFSEAHCPTSARMTDRRKTESDPSVSSAQNSHHTSVSSTRSGATGDTQEARIATAMNESEYEEVLSGPYRATGSQCSTAWSSIATDPPLPAEEKPFISPDFNTVVRPPKRASRK